LRFLLGAGSPLGGARPKSAVVLADGRLALAKFPKPDDVRDMAAGEVLALRLAGRAGIAVAESELVRVGTCRVAVITRFDRSGDPSFRPTVYWVCRWARRARTPSSRMASGNSGTMSRATFANSGGGWSFRCWRATTTTPLRNHGFLMGVPGKWSLSPAYDLNPVPEIERAQVQKTAISEEGDRPSLEFALQAAPRFGLKPAAAREIVRDVHAAVSGWRKVGRSLGLSARTLDAFASAFEHPLMDEAAKLEGGV
jgi:serine/threonine-protein kinase HipA